MDAARDRRLVSPRDVVRSGLCIGCGSCAAQAQGVRMAFDGDGHLKPHGAGPWWREATPAFSATCPFSPQAADETQLARELFADAPAADPKLGRLRSAWVGAVAEDGFRSGGSSGGMVSWVAAELLRRGLVDGVAHVAAAEDPAAEGRFFRYRISRTEQEVRAGAKSRYYPVELADVLAQIRAMPGRYAVVGVPCFVKAVRLLQRHDPVIRERVAFTLGLFCGHMKSARLVESFAHQMGVPLRDVQAVDFRLKDPRRPANWYTAHLQLRDGRSVQRDWFHLAEGDWGSGFFMNSACNFCDDVVAETADISFGDAWLEPYSSDGRGTNVVVVRSKAVEQLVLSGIGAGRLALERVDAGFVRRTQAAGLRQRRQGLAYRLTWARGGIAPRKRVAPDAALPMQRKLLYRIRAGISTWSQRLFRLGAATGLHRLYLHWARGVLALYQGLAYSRGRIGRLAQRLGLAAPDH